MPTRSVPRPHRARPLLALPGATLLAASLPLLAAPGPAPRPVRIGSPFVLDLGTASRWKLSPDRPAVPVATLAPEIAKGIATALATLQEGPDQLGNPTVPSAPEKELIAREKGAVTRQGKVLRVTAGSGGPLVFTDVSLPARKDADPDGEKYTYRGRVGKAGLHHVTVGFQHDAPGSYLVGPASGNVAFVHDGAGHALLAPGTGRIFLLDEGPSPLTMVVAALSPDGVAAEVVCRASGKGRARVEVKGWHGPDALDLVLGLGEKGQEKVPVRLDRTDAGWRLAAPDPKRLAAPDGFGCFTGPFGATSP